MKNSIFDVFDNIVEDIKRDKKEKYGVGKDEIKQIRKQTGLNAEKFGAIVGVGKKTVESWEQGARNPSGPALKMIMSLSSAK